MIKCTYTIKDLERLSGIKAHTIRIWEQRFSLLSPLRSDTNIRNYSDEDLKKILNIAILLENNCKISKIAKLSTDEIKKEVIELEINSEGLVLHKILIDKLIKVTIDFNEKGFDEIFANCVLKFGVENTIVDVVYPFLIKIGVLWTVDDIYPAQEHFVIELIKKKLFVAIDGLFQDFDDNTKEVALLFLPEWEHHEIGLLLAYYLLKKQGKKVIYLGPSVPYENLIKMSGENPINLLITLFIDPQPEEKINLYLTALSQEFKNKKIFISGSHNKIINLFGKANVQLLNSPKDLMNI